MFDIVVRGGVLYDGTGAPPHRADLGIRGDSIEAIDRLEGVEAGRVIDATGLAVAPGFIDTHAHSDVMLLAEPEHAPKLRQGVTTEVLGQDGMSFAPLSPANLQHFRRYLAGAYGNPDIDWSWASVAEFRSRFDGTVAINTAYLVPHGTIRLEVLGMRDAPLVGPALREAQALVATGMEQGAAGLSTGLSYFPGSYSDTDELVELCRTVAARGGVYVSHIRTVFRGRPFDPVEEALEIGRRSGVAVHYSHFRTDPTTAGHVSELMAPIDAARGAGMDVTLDVYPYPSGSGFGFTELPAWVHEGTVDEIKARLSDPETRRRIFRDLQDQRARRAGPPVESAYSHLPSPRNRELIGLTFAEAARQRGATADELLCDLLVEEDLEVGRVQVPPTLDIWEQMDRDIMELFSRPYYTVGSDSIPVGERPHPRAYGCFPRLLGRMRRQYGGISLEALVNRGTLAAAERFGLKDRGVLAPGKAADVVVFDPATLCDRATYDEPCAYPVGIEYVLVNGRVAVERGEPTGVLAGRAIP